MKTMKIVMEDHPTRKAVNPESSLNMNTNINMNTKGIVNMKKTIPITMKKWRLPNRQQRKLVKMKKEAVIRTMKFLIVVVGVKELVPNLIPFVQRSVILTTLVAVAETALSETEMAVVFVRAAAPITILLLVVEMKIGMNVVDVKQPATIPIHLVHLSVILVLAVVEMDGFAIQMEIVSIDNSVSTSVDRMKFSTDVVQVVKELAPILVLLACLIVNLAASRDVNALFLMVLFETILEIVFIRLNVRVKILQAAVVRFAQEDKSV